MMARGMKASWFRMELRRAFINKTFFFCVAAIALLFIYPVLQEWQYGFSPDSGFMYYYRYSHRLSMFRETALILSALPYATSFLGIGIFSIFLAFTTPTSEGLSDSGILFRSLLQSGTVVWYALASATSIAAGAAFLAVLALFFSTLITNHYAILILPLVAFYIFNVIAVFLRLPVYISPHSLMMPEHQSDLGFQAPAPVYWLYIQGFFLVLSVLLGFLFAARVKRRLENVQ